MLPGQVPSDLDLHEIDRGEAAGRHAILSDLYGEFQGAALGYALLAVLIPGLLVTSAHYGWSDSSPDFLHLIAVIAFVTLTAIAVYAWAWFFWTRRRLRAVRKRMNQIRADMDRRSVR